MLKKTSEVKIDTTDAQKQASASAIPTTCPFCGHLSSILIADLDKLHTCFNCNKSYAVKEGTVK